MFERLKWLLPTLSLLLAMALLSVASREPVLGSSLLTTAVLEVVGPVENLLVTSARSVERFFQHYFWLLNLEEENEILKTILETQKQQITQLGEHQGANIRLQGLLGLREAYPHLVMKPAYVLAWDPGPWRRSVTISIGSKDGVAVNQAVIHNIGVVGRIIEVSPNYAQVLLATDFSSSIDAFIQRTRAVGILSGQGTRDMVLKYMRKETDVRPGDLVITSGLDGFFPRGLALGQVSLVNRQNQDIFIELEVTPSVSYDHLEEVMVVISQGPLIDWLSLAPSMKFRLEERREGGGQPPAGDG